MVSLFPIKTFNRRHNGLREDIAKKIEQMKPVFIRFPGGCIIEGTSLETMECWKDSIGPIEQRIDPSHEANRSYGLGFHEYFLFIFRKYLQFIHTRDPGKNRFNYR